MRLLLIFIALVFCLPAMAQEADSSGKAGPVEIDFLINYYEQDGNHSAVTGGIGTEELSDISTQIEVYIPTSKTDAVGVSIHYNHYTSASTDKIDTRMSSASIIDNRARVGLSYFKFSEEWSYDAGAGASIESDYLSTYLSANAYTSFKEDQTILHFGATAYFDQWLMIFPDELRSTAQYSLGNRMRKSLILRLGVSHILNKRMKGGIDLELVGQWGLLSTPFQRVYFSDTNAVSVEVLPFNRYKVPVSAWLNWAVAEKVFLHFRQRLYADSWGILATTTEFGMNIEPLIGLRFHPHFRYHFQTAANYFAEYQQHSFLQNYFTSDWDLSRLHTYEIGMGIRYTPLYGNKKGSDKRAAFRYVHVDFSYYKRSDGLWAWLASLGVGFRL